jgi:hypothetical protein
MKFFSLTLIAFLCLIANLSATVWNYPQDGSTVGNPTYFDCTAPDNPNYMKLWVHGSSTSIWTVHNTNHLVFVYLLPNGTYTMDCQYNDGTTHDNFITITVTNNPYDAANVDDDPYNQGMPYWEQTPGCSSPCTTPDFDTQLDTSSGNQTDGQSRWFSATLHSGGGGFQDVFFYEKRCASLDPGVGIGERAGRYMVNFNAKASSSLPRAFEWGFTQWFNGRNYRMAFQADYASNFWRVYDPVGNAWIQTNVTLTQAPIPTSEFKRVYLVGHPYTDSGGNERVSFDAIQIGECTSAPCTDTDSDPIRPVAISPNVNVGTVSESCFGGEGNSQSVQLDLDSTRTSGKVWTDKYYVHLQP